MLNNYFTIREISRYLNKNISGYIIKEIYTQEKNKLFLEVSNKEINHLKLLEYSILQKFNYLIFKNNFTKAKKNYVSLFEEIYGKKILKISLYQNDRVINFELENDLKMLFTFFSKPNCFLTDGSRITNSFKSKDEYLLRDILEVIPPKDNSIISKHIGMSINDYIKLHHRVFGNLYREEVLYRINFSKEEIIDDNKIEMIDREFNTISNGLNNPKFLLYSDNKYVFISLIELHHLNHFNFLEFNNINELISEYIKLKFKKEKVELARDTIIHTIQQKLKNLNKKLSSLQTQLQYSRESDNFKKIGNCILENLDYIKKGDSKFYYISDDDKKINFKLKENLSSVDNAQHYFEKYKKQKNSLKVLETKINDVEREKAKLESELNHINKLDNYKILMKEEKKITKIKKDETSKFRKFKLNDKYEVWVGKNSESNDLLTTKYSEQNDLWFHVRGTSGSHTVLKVNKKKENIDGQIIKKAASIAAYYSKARNSSSVPVAYCEKKYVKKKKGLKAGSVIMEREKVIFVKPSLPEAI